MSLKGRKVFVRKNGSEKGGQLYKWTPFDNHKKIKKEVSKNIFFCNTPLGGQGNDNISTYSYVSIIVSGQIIKTAYVQCDYVQ